MINHITDVLTKWFVIVHFLNTQISYKEIAYSDGRHMSSNVSLGLIQPGDWLNIPAVVAALKKLYVRPVTPESEHSVAMWVMICLLWRPKLGHSHTKDIEYS